MTPEALASVKIPGTVGFAAEGDRDVIRLEVVYAEDYTLAYVAVAAAAAATLAVSGKRARG